MDGVYSVLNWMSGEVLAIEVTGDEVRAAVVRKIRRRFEILDFALMKKETADDDLPSVDVIKSFAERLRPSTRRAVFVSPMARAFELRMDRAKVSALKRPQLLEAVKWEAEPYTGITGPNALIGVQYSLKQSASTAEIVYDDDQVPITVAAIERNVYRAVKERFRLAGFKLSRIYPPDVTFYMPLLMEKSEVPRAILEVGQDYSNFAIVRGQSPELISTMAMSLESLSAHLSEDGYTQGLEDTLRFMARQVPGPEKLLISGSGAADQAVVAYIQALCDSGAAPLYLSRSAGISDTGNEAEHAVYGTVVGAAVRELLGSKEQTLGVNDDLTLAERLKKSAYLFPVVVTGLTLSLLFGHYGYMRYKESSYKQQTEALNREIKERKAKMEEQERLNNELTTVRAAIERLKQKQAFATGQSDRDLLSISTLLQDLGRAIPDKVILVSLAYEDRDIQSLAGVAAGQGVIGQFITHLQQRYWCGSVALTKVERKGDQQQGLLYFELELKTRFKQGAAR
jgi:Tfp pilus assembly protein PilN